MATLIPSLSRGSAVALLVAGTLFMENLDGTVILTAMPQMANAFHVHAVDMNIGVSAYLLTLATLIPVSGWMADKHSVRSIFSCAIVIFTLASILCGLCQNLTAFTLARILQGVGGAMMVPVGRLAVLRSAEKHELISAIATITWPGLAAPVLGPRASFDRMQCTATLAKISIRDSGPRVPYGALLKLFQPFGCADCRDSRYAGPRRNEDDFRRETASLRSSRG
jgi:MFS family permease